MLCWPCSHGYVGKYYSQEKHLSVASFRIYDPSCRWCWRHLQDHSRVVLALLSSTHSGLFETGAEFMPPLNEGAYCTADSLAGAWSVTEAAEDSAIQDRDF